LKSNQGQKKFKTISQKQIKTVKNTQEKEEKKNIEKKKVPSKKEIESEKEIEVPKKKKIQENPSRLDFSKYSRQVRQTKSNRMPLRNRTSSSLNPIKKKNLSISKR